MFQQKYVESTASNILMQIWISSDDSTFSYNEKHERYTTNRNHSQSHHCSRQTQFPICLYDCLISHVMLSTHEYIAPDLFLLLMMSLFTFYHCLLTAIIFCRFLIIGISLYSTFTLPYLISSYLSLP